MGAYQTVSEEWRISLSASRPVGLLYLHFNRMSDKKLGFFESFLLSGVAAGVSKTAAAPIERVKLLVQNQDEMLKQGILDKPYTGVIDCTTRVLKTEGVYPFWRGNLANVLRYFPTQALNFAFKDTVKGIFKTPKDASAATKFATNITSGGVAGTLSHIRLLPRLRSYQIGQRCQG